FGMVLADEVQGQGFGYLLLKYMIGFAKRLNKKKIWGACFADNDHALRLYKKLGFMFEGVFLNEEKLYNTSTTKEEYRHLYSLAIHLGRNEGSTYEYYIGTFKDRYENM